MDKIKDIINALWKNKIIIIIAMILIILFQACRNCNRSTNTQFAEIQYQEKITTLQKDKDDLLINNRNLQDSLKILQVRYESLEKQLEESKFQAKSLQEDKKTLKDIIKRQNQ